MLITLNEPEPKERLTDRDSHPANTTTTLSVWATLSDGMPGYQEMRLPFAGGECVGPIQGGSSPWVMPTITALAALLQLRAGWDTRGSPPIQVAYAKSALDVIFAVMRDNTPAPSVVPTSRGGVQIEWHTRGIDLEVEFETPYLIRGFFEDHRAGQSWEKDLSIDQNALVQAITVLSQRT